MTYFANKSIVITGAASGIGLSLAKKFLERNAFVVALDLDKKGLQELKDFSDLGCYWLRTECLSVCDYLSLEQLTKNLQTKRIGEPQGIDIWINAAGTQSIGRFDEIGRERFHRIFNVNFSALVDCTELALAVMKEQGSGAIVNMASMAGFVPAPFMASYVASKHAIVGYTRALQLELDLEKWPLHMMLVSPGFVDTPMTQGEAAADQGFPKWLSWMLSKPEVVADQVITGLLKKKREIAPTTNGKIMRFAHSIAPWQTSRSSRVLLTDSPWSALLGRYNR